MNASELRELQAPLKARYRDEPQAGVVTLRATRRVSPDTLSCKVETGKAIVEAGLHPATGGSGLAACSGDMLLEALAACAGVTLSAVATALGVEIRDGRVLVEGDLDFRGTLGVAKDAPVGFRDIRVHFEFDADGPPETLAKVIQLTERYCVVFQTLTRPPSLAMTQTNSGGAARAGDQ
jgi:uncharacterized OsmC-like protein